MSLNERGVRYAIPFQRNRNFTGRDATLDLLRDKFFAPCNTQRFALFGLGGVGKTQVALQFAYWVKKHETAFSIFWAPALSTASFEKAYLEIGRELDLTLDDDREHSMTLIRKHLSSTKAGRWLLIVDNADDMDVMFGPDRTAGISQYLPHGDYGLILFTTRSQKLATSLAESNVVELDKMTPVESTSLFEKLLGLEQRPDKTMVAELLQRLTHLPLAIRQAAAYLNCNSQTTIAEYLDLMRGTEQDLIELMSEALPDNTRYPGLQNAIATTWLVSFEQIKKTNSTASTILSFISCIEPKAIPHSLFPKVSSNVAMNSAIGILCGYAFLSRLDANLYEMHSLVHLAIKVWIENKSRTRETIVDALNHMEIAFATRDDINQLGWRSYFPHSIRLLERSKALGVDKRLTLSATVGRRLFDDRQFKEAIKWLQDYWEWKKRLQEEDHSRLASEHELVSAYLSDRRIKEAIKIFEHVVEVFQKTL